MGYETLEKVIELTDSSEALKKRLDSVADVLSHAFSFDQCAIYLYDEDKKIFNLCSLAGDEGGVVVTTYQEREGLPHHALAMDKPVIANMSDADRVVWRGIEDRGMTGFATAAVYPVKDDTSNYGVLYLKNRHRKVLSKRRRKLLDIIALQLSMTIKTQYCISNLTAANAQMRDMQARLIHAEKLVALGEMAATLAHEIKNPLLSIGGFAKRLSRQFNEDAPARLYVDMIAKESIRVEKLLDTILSFSVNKGFELNEEDINNVVNDALAFFEGEFRRVKIKVDRELKPDITPVRVDREQLKLAFSNFFANSMQAMGNGGILTLRTYSDDRWVFVEVTDTGGGIEPDIIRNIFNPFFTTKEDGTGLGLSIAHAIVTNHNGIIEVVNDLGKGVSFIIKLPAALKG
ncbi:MAG: hypothetical protein A2073_00740 [Deltaproteobacteria bacterium GWC2_42_11]|nr:MAG: hypothetical protein A2073_00740 [Deltaproteobacteria bacterium GWC2_42_11]HBO83404.1 hypothetical protein [Deltaproteobacteria bacterium]